MVTTWEYRTWKCVFRSIHLNVKTIPFSVHLFPKRKTSRCKLPKLKLITASSTFFPFLFSCKRHSKVWFFSINNHVLLNFYNEKTRNIRTLNTAAVRMHIWKIFFTQAPAHKASIILWLLFEKAFKNRKNFDSKTYFSRLSKKNCFKHHLKGKLARLRQ